MAKPNVTWCASCVKWVSPGLPSMALFALTHECQNPPRCSCPSTAHVRVLTDDENGPRLEMTSPLAVGRRRGK